MGLGSGPGFTWAESLIESCSTSTAALSSWDVFVLFGRNVINTPTRSLWVLSTCSCCILKRAHSDIFQTFYLKCQEQLTLPEVLCMSDMFQEKLFNIVFYKKQYILSFFHNYNRWVVFIWCTMPLILLYSMAESDQSKSQKTNENKSYMFLNVVKPCNPRPPFYFSPIKYAGGDCWPRSPLLTGGGPSVLQSPQDQAMELSTPEQMDVTNSSEASAPLPIRKPTGVNMGQMKQQAYPVAAKRPEHLRMNLWPTTPL